MNGSKNIKLNMLINGIKGLLTVLFPLISFPYISRVLLVDNIGRFNFANSTVSYFVIIAGLGINTYATCEGARHRENREALSRFASEVYSVNVISTAVSYLLLFLSIVFVDKFHEYTALIVVLSLQIACITLGKEWLCAVFEDYLYMAVRYIVFQLLSLAALFVFVKDAGDCLIYATIVLLSVSGAQLTNYFRLRRFCEVRFVFSRRLISHIKPIFVFFATAVTVTIYTNCDITILGFLTSDETVGLYSVSVKIYTIVKSFLASAIVVSIPRMAALSANSDAEMLHKTATEIYEVVVSVIVPAIVGVAVLAEEIVWIVAGETYMDAAVSLKLLSVAILFSLLAYFWTQCVLYAFKRENLVLMGTIMCAIVNIVLNLVLIPMWQQNAAAFTTVFSEGLSALIFAYFGRKYIRISGAGTLLLKIAAGCAGIVAIDIWMASLDTDIGVRTAGTILGAVAAYLVIEILLKNNAVYSVLETVIQKAEGMLKK